MDSLVVLAKRSAAALLVAVWPTKPERPLRRWRTLSAPVAGTGRPVGNSEQVAELQDPPMSRKLAMAPVEEVVPLLETSAMEWAEASWAPISTAWMAMMSEALTVAQWADPMTAWLGTWQMAHHCPRLPPSIRLVKACMEAVLDFSMEPRRGTISLER